MATPQSDSPVDRLVARSMRVRSAAPREACPDADVLAAFAERSLDRKETRRIERHASSCWRCTRVVSTVLAADPLAALRPRPAFWTAWGPWRWAVPLVTAVIVAGVWLVSTPGNLRTSTPPSSARVSQEKAGNAADGKDLAPAPPPVAAPTLADNTAQERAAPRVDGRARQGFGGASRDARTATSDLKESVPLERDENRLAKAESAEPAAPASTVDRIRRRAQATSIAAPSAADAALAFPIISSPDPKTLWRANGAAIERSTDGGDTWTLQYTADSPIRGGAATSTDVAWFFGTGGLVLRRTVSGWSVATARPGNAEIASIDPGGPAEAIVTLVDGRQFETRDGGVSWQVR